MKTRPRMLSILMNGHLIGQLEKSLSGSLIFVYHPTWLETPGARPISLSLPLVEQPFMGDVAYNFFDNLLPDNPEIRARIQAKFQIKTNQTFDLLAGIGKDCIGALQIIDGDIPLFKKEINCEPLDEKTMASILRHYQKYPLGMVSNSDDFRISIAGVQEKSAFLYHQGKWCRPQRETPTSHIFKLPIGYIQRYNIDLSDSCENEWLCLQIAKTFGLPTANSDILYFEETKVLAVERFDRKLSSDHTWLIRLPQEDMCQALGISSNLKYQGHGGPGIHEIMQLLLGSMDPIADRDIFYRAQVLFWLLAAMDGHAKNFSLFIEPEGQYSLTPLYDVMSAYPLMTKKQLQSQKIKMAMALRGRNNHYHWHNIQRRHFLETAKIVKYSIERAETILDDMLQQVDAVIAQVSAKLPEKFPKAISEPIFEGMRLMKKKLAEKQKTP